MTSLHRIAIWTTALILSASLLADQGCQQECAQQLHTVPPEKIGVKTKVFFDPIRGRPLVTEIFYPVTPDAEANREYGLWKRADEARDAPIHPHVTKLPLILMSHGNNGTRVDSAWLGEVLAANGYLVASVDHYGNTWYLRLPEESVQTWERPIDISFVLQKLLDDPTFGPKIDRDKIGFIGYSLGGLTGIQLAGAVPDQYPKAQIPKAMRDKVDMAQFQQDFHNSAIKAMVLLAPNLGHAFTPQALAQIHIPVAIIVGAADDVTPASVNADYYAQHISGAQLKVLAGNVGHFIFLNVPSKQGRSELPTRIVTDGEGVEREVIHQEVADYSVCFFNCTLKGAALPPASEP